MRTCLLTGLCMLLLAAESPDVQPVKLWADEATNTLGSPSRDGRYLSFVDTQTGNLAVRDLLTGAIRKVTNRKPSEEGQFAYFSAFSPDSKSVAYAWFNEKKFYELRIANADGSGSRVLYRNEEAGFVQPCAWSPDGSQILTLLFRRDNISQIALIPLDGGTPRVLKSLNWIYPKRMDFSPDGRFIVYDSFARDGSPERDIFVLATDGSREIELVKHPASDLFPLWHYDGKTIYFASDRNGSMSLWAIPVAEGKPSGEPWLVKAGLGRFLPMGLTSAGDLIYGLREGLTDVYIAVPGSRKARALPTRFAGRNTTPEWSADGRWLAILSRRGTENYGEDSRVVTIHELETGRERDLELPLAHIERALPSPDGRRLLISGSDNKGRAGVFVAEIDSRRIRPVAAEAGANFRGYPAAWNGKSAVWSSRRTIHSFDPTTRKTADLHQASCDPEHLDASPAARAIAWSCGEEIYVLDPKGKTRQIASAPKQVTRLRWLTDEELFVAAGSQLFRFPADGSPAIPAGSLKGSRGDVSLHRTTGRMAFTAGGTKSEVWRLKVAR